MSAESRAIRVEQAAQALAAVGVDVAAMVRDAYAEGLRDGLNRARALDGEPGPDALLVLVEGDVDDVAQRRPLDV